MTVPAAKVAAAPLHRLRVEVEIMARQTRKSRAYQTPEPREFSPLAVAVGNPLRGRGAKFRAPQSLKPGRIRESYMVETNLGGILEDVPGLDAPRVMAGSFPSHSPPGPRLPFTAMPQDGQPSLELVFNEGFDWSRVPDTTRTPWRSICHLQIQFASGSGSGTGWFVDNRTIITAGHNLLHPKVGWASGIAVRPGLNRGGAGLDIGAYAVAGNVHPQWEASAGKSRPHDIGYLKLADPSIGNFVGAFGLRVLSDDELTFGDLIVHSSGYPSTKPRGTQWVDASRLNGFSDAFVFYRLDTIGGNSGAPIFATFANGQRLVIACHTHGTADRSSNAGLRVTDEIFDMILSWL